MQCPNCELQIDLHLNSDSGDLVKPEIADLSICYDCGQAMIFDGKDMIAFEKPDWIALPVMSRLQLHWNWQKWNLKNSIRGN